MKKSNDQIISIQALLKGRNPEFDNTSSTAIKMLRHADQRVGGKNDNAETKKLLIDGQPVPNGISSLYELYVYRRDLFDKYQSEQQKGKFNGALNIW